VDKVSFNMKNYLKEFSDTIFNQLKADEDLGLFLHSEDSLFLRFNGSKVRQNTTVCQHELTLTFQAQHKVIKMTFNLTLNLDVDLKVALQKIEQARIDLSQIDISPKYVPLINNGHSETYKKIDRPKDEEMAALISELFAESDLAGLWCSGPLRSASLNSKGQFHYFETDYFFFDYSLYDGPKAAKGFYAAEKFDYEEFKIMASDTKNKLRQLQKTVVQVQRGKYRVYLEPMAVAEILGTMSWAGLGQASYQQGRSPLKKLKDNEVQLSEKFTLLENLNLGLSPQFNSIGEVSAANVMLIENGKMTEFLTSSASANEYKLASNHADTHESPRSPEVRAGALAHDDILKKLGTGLYLSNLHYINWSDQQTARMTGMTRFACFWVENGEIVGPISDLRFDETIYHIFGSGLIDLSQHQEVFANTSTYMKRSFGAMKVPGALIENFNFTL
jgi:predicted Zn-dependent protease